MRQRNDLRAVGEAELSGQGLIQPICLKTGMSLKGSNPFMGMVNPYLNSAYTSRTLLQMVLSCPCSSESSHLLSEAFQGAREKQLFFVLSSENAGHRDWRNVKNNLQNTAKEPEKPTTTTNPKCLVRGFEHARGAESSAVRILDST